MNYKIYIAGKIGAAGVEAMRCHFDQAAKMLRWFNWEPVNPCDIPYAGSWEECMVADMHAMLDCDALYALRNWKSSPGATIEIITALRLRKQVIYEAEVMQQSDGSMPMVCVCPACGVEINAPCYLCPFAEVER